MSPNPTLSAGPILIGVLLSYFLYGVYITNLFRYISKQSTKGGPITYSHVALTLTTIVEAVSIGFITNGIWVNLVEGINDPSKRDKLPYTNVWVPIFNGAVATMVQIFFAQKIYILGKHSVAKGLAVFIGLLSALQFATAICIPILYLKTTRTIVLPSVSEGFTTSVATHLSSTLACDILITACMIVILARFKRRATFSATRRMLNTLTVHTIENGLVTTILALINLVLYFSDHRSSSQVMIHYILSRVYANVMIISLNHSSTANPQGISTNDTYPPTSIIDLPEPHSPTSPLELKLKLKRSNGNFP